MQKARCGRDDFLVRLVGFDFEHRLAFLDMGARSLEPGDEFAFGGVHSETRHCDAMGHGQ